MTFIEGAEKVFSVCMQAKTTEDVLIVTDTDRQAIGRQLFDVAESLGLKAVLQIMKPTGRHGAEPPRLVATSMQAADVVLCPTQYSLTHTEARRSACEHGARIATMPGVTEEMFLEGAIGADYSEIARVSDALADRLTAAEQVTIRYRDSEVSFSIANRTGVSSRGLYHEPGSSGNLPTGEAYIAPVEGTANGVVVFDGSAAGLGQLSGPLRVEIRDGIAVDFSGPDAEALSRALGDGRDARNIAELGIGTNPKARLSGSLLEDEKVFGTVHLAFGSNKTFGGLVDAGVHIDCVMLQPELLLDGQLLVSGGHLLV